MTGRIAALTQSSPWLLAEPLAIGTTVVKPGQEERRERP
jgi:hypothetical protein